MARGQILVAVSLSKLVEEFPQKAKIQVSRAWLEKLGYELKDVEDTTPVQIETSNMKIDLTDEEKPIESTTSTPFGAFAPIG